MKFSWKAFVKCKVNQFWLAKFISKLNQILVLGQPSPAAIFALIFIKLNGRKRQPLICTWVISVTFFYISLFAFSLFIKNRIPVTLSITFKQIKQQWPEKRKRDYSAKFLKTDLIENTLFSTQTWSTASSTFVRTKITGIPKSSNCLANQQELDILFRVKWWKIELSEN